MSITKDDVKAFIKGMTVLELAGFIKELEDELGVSAAAPIAIAAGPAAAAEAPKVEEKTEFTVILATAGADRIKVIKEVRAITGLGLKEAKELVDGVPKPLKESVSKDEAAEIKGKIEAAGATVEIK